MDSNTLMTTILDMAKDIAKTKEIVVNHDVSTFPEIKESIKKIDSKVSDIDHRTIGLDSWKNGIIDLVIEEKEKVLFTLRQESKDSFQIFDKRVEILELRKKKGDEFVVEVKKTIFTKTGALITTGVALLIAWLSK